MSPWTAFVDESGLFEPDTSGWLPGMRLVAGVLLPFEPETAEQFCAEVLQRALQQVGLERVSSAVHATRIAHPQSFGAWLLASQETPDALQDVARNEHLDELRTLGQRVLRALRYTVAREVAQQGGWVLGVCEYGCPSTRQGLSGPLPYRRMVLAWLEHAVLETICQKKGPGLLHAVIAHRTRPAPSHVSLWGERLAALRGSQFQVQLSTEVAFAEQRRGLQVADILAHGLGPGVTQRIPPSQASIAARSQAGLATLVEQRFKAPLRYLERDALLDFRHVNEATLALERPSAFERIADRARALPQQNPLPCGTFPASLEACAAAVPHLWSPG